MTFFCEIKVVILTYSPSFENSVKVTFHEKRKIRFFILIFSRKVMSFKFGTRQRRHFYPTFQKKTEIEKLHFFDEKKSGKFVNTRTLI